MDTVKRLAIVLLLISLAGAAAADGGLLVNARIHTMDPRTPEAGAMAWDDSGRLLAVGDRELVESRYPLLPRIDADGATVVPGLIDAHGHLMGLGLALLRADLTGLEDVDAVVERLREFEQDLPPGAWLLGRGWDQSRWPGGEFPTAVDLDAAFPERPVWLERVDGHAGWANSAAMAKVERDLGGDWQPDGGRILREDGVATGVFIDAAATLVEAEVPPPDDALLERALRRALAEAARFGLTGVHDAGVPLAQLGLYRRLADAGELPLRVHAMADGDSAALEALCAMGAYRHPSGRLQMRTVKLYIDGALGSRGAALLEDYSDEPGNRGLLVTSPAAFADAVRKARRCGIQVAAHAIGDRGNRLVLDTFESELAHLGDADHRWRVEHAQVVTLDDIPRFAGLDVIASMQPTHATSDMRWAEQRVGAQRIAGAYAWRRMVEAGVRLALGSDFPVEQVDPVLGLHAAVSRQDIEGMPEGGWIAAQRLTMQEALAGFTRDAAYAGFAEGEVGALAPGKRADFVILSGDPLRTAVADVHRLRVLATYVDGDAVFERAE